MRTIAAVFLFCLVGCGDESTAGPGSGGAGGDTGTAGTTGDGGGAGAAGTTGAGGAAAPSCNIPIGQVSGEDSAAQWTRCDGSFPGSAVRVVNGAVDFFGAWPTVGSFAIAPAAGGQCAVDIRYDRPGDCIQGERLFVHLVVPAI
jgi:hypothetical protein